MSIIIWTIQLLIIPAMSPLFVGVIRKIKAKMQNRQGAGIFQPYKDLRKLFNKDEVISSDASWVFRQAPYIIFGVTLVVGAIIPVFSAYAANNYLSDFLVVVYLLALGTFFLALSGIDVGSAFGGFGSSREMTVAALAEGGLIFSFLALAIASHSSNLFQISSSISAFSLAQFVPVLLAFSGFFLALLAENGRFPFDNPATHLELTMIHEAMILEYSGKRLALIEWAAANKLLIFMALASNLFFPWGIASSLGLGAILVAILIFMAKVLIICFGIAFLESTIAKLRFFRLPDLLFTSFILSVIAIGLLIS
jgi:formate hydrogenlyase subunit 4